MTSQLIRWYGPGRREALRAAVAARLQLWLQQWALTPEGLSVQLSTGAIDSGAWQRCTGADGANAWAGLGRTDLAQLGSLLANAPLRHATDYEHARAVGTDALQAMFASLLEHASTQRPEAALPDGALVERHGWVALDVCWAAFTFVLLMDPALCDQLAPPQRKSAGLTRRASALGPSRATLTARLDLGSVDVALVSSLRPGDVLRTSVPLDALLSLAAAEGRTVSTGRLALLDQHKAITVESSL